MLYDVINVDAAVVYVMLAVTSQSPAVRLIDIMSRITPEDNERELAVATKVCINCPTFPAFVLSIALVPVTPLVVGLNAMVVAVTLPNTGLVKTDPEEPVKLPVPVFPDNGTFKLFIVAII